MPKQIAIWNSARDVWETPETNGLFCEHLAVFSEVFPTSGMTLNGVAYELPTWERHTLGSGYSSSRDVGELLLTPVASEGIKPSNTMGVARRLSTGQVFLTNQIVTLCGLDPSERLLPTPEARLAGSGPDFSRAERGSGGDDLQTKIHLLRTPCAAEASGGPRNPNRSGATMRLSDQVREELLPATETPKHGATTGRPSGAGSRSSAGQLLGQLSLLDETGPTD